MQRVINYKLIKNNLPFSFLSIILIVILIYSFFYPIPTESGVDYGVGVGSKLLNIGDRFFYHRSNTDMCEYKSVLITCDEYYGQIKPGPLYPFLIKIISKFLNFFGINNTSKIWNFFLISITTFLTFASLYFIEKSAYVLSRTSEAKYASWLFVFCPYTYFFAINGGLTMYMIFGVSLSTYLIINFNFGSKIHYKNTFLIKSASICISGIYLSLLRPTGTIFSLIIILVAIFILLRKIFNHSEKKLLLISLIFFISSFIFLLSQFSYYSSYIDHSLTEFNKEYGNFFGVDRTIIREALSKDYNQISDTLKQYVYLIIWKINDFIAGLLDIRGTHTLFTNNSLPPLFPFLMRVSTGLFYLIPVNMLFVFGIIYFRKIVLSSGLWIVSLASLISISPSIMGYSNSRFLIMFYPPFLIIAGLMLSVILSEKGSKKLHNFQE